MWAGLERILSGSKGIMSDTGTITRCIRDLESGESSRRNTAAAELWEFFFADLMCYARRRLQAAHVSRGAADEEDAAERAFTKVCRAIERGTLKLSSRIDLRKVLRSAATSRGDHIAPSKQA